MRDGESRFAASTQRWILVFATALATALTIAPAANAERGIVGYYDFETCPIEKPCVEPGQIGVTRFFALNGTGAGAAEPGDFYMGTFAGTFSDDGRIHTTSATGQPKNIWGTDVVLEGPNNADELQGVMVSATGGSYALNFKGDATGPIPYNADAATLEAELETLSGLTVTVSGGLGNASGSAPYLVTFDGASGDTNQPLIRPENSTLTGGDGVNVYTINPGDVGAEICVPGSGDACKQGVSSSGAINDERAMGGAVSAPAEHGAALDQQTGELYVTDLQRINKFSASGEFKRAWGYDVVRAGPNDSDNDEVLRLTVNATAGTYELCYPNCANLGAERSEPIPYNAAPAVVKSTFEALKNMTDAGGEVEVTGGPGGPNGLNPYTITFIGNLAGDDVFNISADSTNLLGTATVSVLNNGGRFEVCAEGNACKSATLQAPPGGITPTDAGGSPSGALAVAPEGTSNEGNVLASSGFQGSRVMEYTPNGDFVRAFGWDVVAKGPGDSAGPDEQQNVTIKATGGKFSLIFQGATTGATGTGLRTNGSNVLTNVNTTSGAFVADQAITGSGIPAGTSIETVGAGTLTLTANATSGNNALTELTAHDLAFDATEAQVETALNALPTIGGVGGSVSVAGGPGDLNGTTPYEVTFGGTLGGDDVPNLEATSTALTSGGSKSATVTPIAAGGAFEVCKDADGDFCKNGVSGTAPGHLGEMSTLEESPSGEIYTVQAPTFGQVNRVQKFTPQAGPPELAPSVFGQDEVQTATVNAGAGEFRLAYGVIPNAVEGIGDFNQGSRFITDVTTVTGQFEVGQEIRDGSTGLTLFPSNVDVFITAVGPDFLEISRAPQPGGKVDAILKSDAPRYTTNLPYNAPPNGAGSVEEALNALPTINSGGGSVSVTGGPGDAGGTSPYEITFGGGRLHTVDALPIKGVSAVAPAPPLTGGTGPGADSVTMATTQSGGPSGTNYETTPLDVGFGPSGEVFVNKQFAAGATTCYDGSPSPGDMRVLEFTPSEELVETSLPCGEIPAHGGGGGPQGQAHLSVDPVSGIPYTRSGGSFDLRINAYGEIGTAPDLVLNAPSGVQATSANISGTIDPNGPTPNSYPKQILTLYRLEFKKSSEGPNDWKLFAPDVPIGGGNSPIPYNIGLGDLSPKTEYDVRIVVSKPTVAVIQDEEHFTTTAAPPTIDGFHSAKVGASTADLHAVINPRGTATSYHFEYGRTPEFGQETPETPIGDSLTPVSVQNHLENLDSGVYYFRVVATNAIGTVESHHQSFTFYPEPCPNSTVRQQTGSGGLPDCRAYELVTPGAVGSVIILPTGPSSPWATNPPRLAFGGAFGRIVGVGDPPGLGGQYIATRRSTGWTTRYVGIPGYVSDGWSVFPQPTGFGKKPHQSDYAMTKYIDFDNNPEFDKEGYIAPFVWHTETGASLGRFPTNLEDIPNAANDVWDGGFLGEIDPSGDFSHFAFSSANLAFAPGGLTSGSGSAYDNDVNADTVTIISKLANGEDIPEEPNDEADHDFLAIHGSSADGSHIVIGAPGTGICGTKRCPPRPYICGQPENFTFLGSKPLNDCPIIPMHLYMRVNNSITYDVSQGALVLFKEISKDGSTIYFTSPDQLTADDNDNSLDLFMWTIQSEEITRVSVGSSGNIGDTDGCTSAWTAKCGIEVVPKSNPLSGNGPPHDTIFAEEAGDNIYFYSPEQLDDAGGVPGKRNLYVYRNGDIQYVTTLDADKPATRFQVSSNGRWAAFITATRLGTYDNAGFGQMYRYDPESDELRCVSCSPSGALPTSDVVGSLNGIFLTDDGRTFFSTKDSLVPADTNGHITDVYEYVDGRAQLLTSGTASIDSSLGGAISGFVGVTADGINAYISTTETFVAADKNGPFPKIYNARTNGGFPVSAQVAPCAAADECHGPGNSPRRPSTIASGAVLGSSGNIKRARGKRCVRKGKKTRKGKRCSGKRGKKVKRGKKSKRSRKSKRRAGK